MLCACVIVTTDLPDIIERMKNGDSSVTLDEILMSDKAKSMFKYRCDYLYTYIPTSYR